MYNNDLTEDRTRTVLFIGKLQNDKSDLEAFLRETEILFIQLLHRGYDTILFPSSHPLWCLTARFIRRMKTAEQELFCLCVLNNPESWAGVLNPDDIFDAVTVLEHENMSLPTDEFYKYLLDCSGLLASYNPTKDAEIALVESLAGGKKIPIIRMRY